VLLVTAMLIKSNAAHLEMAVNYVRMCMCVCSWQRETRIRSFTPRKIIGEVLYITPCERKLRNYNEVDKVCIEIICLTVVIAETEERGIF